MVCKARAKHHPTRKDFRRSDDFSEQKTTFGSFEGAFAQLLRFRHKSETLRSNCVSLSPLWRNDSPKRETRGLRIQVLGGQQGEIASPPLSTREPKGESHAKPHDNTPHRRAMNSARGCPCPGAGVADKRSQDGGAQSASSERRQDAGASVRRRARAAPSHTNVRRRARAAPSHTNVRRRGTGSPERRGTEGPHRSRDWASCRASLRPGWSRSRAGRRPDS
jgi:hypothetical protein